MNGPQAGFERRVQGALDASPSRIPVVLGGCGTGRTWLLQRLRDRLGRGAAQYIDVERCATTPERFLQAVTSSSPFPAHGTSHTPATAREAFDTLISFFDTARAPGGDPKPRGESKPCGRPPPSRNVPLTRSVKCCVSVGTI